MEIDRKEMALGGTGVALAASGNSGSKSGASTTATTTQRSSSGHCDGDQLELVTE